MALKWRFWIPLYVLILTGWHSEAGSAADTTTAQRHLQTRGEVYLHFRARDRSQINRLTEIISIDNVQGLDVWAYANSRGFRLFQATGLAFETLPPPGERRQSEGLSKRGTHADWDTYPSYDVYLGMMQRFASDHPQRCALEELGRSVEERQLLCARVCSRVDSAMARPRCLLTAGIHGDETTGYVLLLRLIDTLLMGYGRDSAITALLDSTEIWICPQENPDATYAGGNGSVNGATRFNANGVDLNRNYPNPGRGDHPDGEPWQPETQAMMRLTDSLPFVLSVALHGGAEVVNYPWDSWTSDVKTTADHLWWQAICRRYASLVHAHSSGYMTGFDQGITEGGDWYIVYGSRQDYLNYFKQCRELTIEISNDKLADSGQLPAYWEYNYRSLLGLLRECRYGISGIVTDSLTAAPLRARVQVEVHDRDGSQVESGLPFGDYYRPIAPGIYTLTFSCEGYFSKTITNVEVADRNTTRLNVKLLPVRSAVSATQASGPSGFSLEVAGGSLVIVNQTGTPIESFTLFDLHGRQCLHYAGHVVQLPARWSWSGRDQAGRLLGSGTYLAEVRLSDGQRLSRRIILSPATAGITVRTD